MPSSRRKSGPRPAQSTLSFNNKPTRVTKPAAAATHLTGKKGQTSAELPVQDLSIPETETTEEEEPSATEIAKPKAVQKPSSNELQAQKITDKQITTYWKYQESTRLTPRIHQQSLTIQERILRHFDLSSQYGPCIGISRRKRWQRAEGLELGPPVEVLAVLLKQEQEERKSGAEEQGKGRMAYIDELAGGRVVDEDD